MQVLGIEFQMACGQRAAGCPPWNAAHPFVIHVCNSIDGNRKHIICILRTVPFPLKGGFLLHRVSRRWIRSVSEEVQKLKFRTNCGEVGLNVWTTASGTGFRERFYAQGGQPIL